MSQITSAVASKQRRPKSKAKFDSSSDEVEITSAKPLKLESKAKSANMENTGAFRMLRTIAWKETQFSKVHPKAESDFLVW